MSRVKYDQQSRDNNMSNLIPGGKCDISSWGGFSTFLFLLKNPPSRVVF